MKVLQVNITSNWGSTGRIAEDIGMKIIEDGGDSYIAYGRSSNRSESINIKIGNCISIYVHILFTRIFDRHGLASYWATKKLIHQIDDINPDIIHLHNIHGYYLHYPIFFAYLKKKGIPIVWTLHDCWSFTGHCSHFVLTHCSKWKKVCYNCPQKISYPTSWFFDRSRENHIQKKESFLGLQDVILVTVSKWLKGIVSQSFLGVYPIEVIHNGIDTDIFQPIKCNKGILGLPDKFLIIGVANVWSEEKGLADFLKLREMLPSDYQFLLIGLSKDQINKLPNGIMGIERTNSIKQLAQYYSVADVFFNSSKEETFGLTTAEAMACGTPAIVYNSSACPEIISKETGFVVEIGDYQSIVRILSHLHTIGKSNFSQKCRERALSLFNKKDRYQDYINLYHKILNKHYVSI